MKKKQDLQRIDKENFIDFLVQSTPEDLNRLIQEKGKPKKPYTPVFIYKNKEKN